MYKVKYYVEYRTLEEDRLHETTITFTTPQDNTMESVLDALFSLHLEDCEIVDMYIMGDDEE